MLFCTMTPSRVSVPSLKTAPPSAALPTPWAWPFYSVTSTSLSSWLTGTLTSERRLGDCGPRRRLAHRRRGGWRRAQSHWLTIIDLRREWGRRGGAGLTPGLTVRAWARRPRGTSFALCCLFPLITCRKTVHIQETSMFEIHTILFPTDLSEHSKRALPLAYSLARDHGAV